VSDLPVEETPHVVIRDKRRIDPATGEARATDADPTTGPPVAGPASGVPAQVAELTEDLQRLKAEYDNYRRRVERDRLAVVEMATAALLTQLLPVLDNIDRAREHGDLTGAFAVVGDDLVAITSRLGLERFGEPGEPFDPTIHEALLQHESGEVSEPTAVEILRPGYRFASRVLRAAQVSVAEPPAGHPASEEPVDEAPGDGGAQG
jgi:molecular chaperone GrpE